MKIGLVPPEGYFDEFDGWSATRAWDRVLAICARAEELGFDSLWLGEHVLAKWNRRAPIFDFFTLAAGIAAAVPRIAIGFCVVNSTFRNPALTAKMAGTLDAISHGRLILGLGAGFKESEAEAFGVPYPEIKERLAILAEHFEIISRLTTKDAEPLTFEGQYASVHDLTGAPYGAQEPRIPLLIGGHGKNVTFRLAAKYCDGDQHRSLDGGHAGRPRRAQGAMRGDRPRSADAGDRGGDASGVPVPGPQGDRQPADDDPGGPAGGHVLRHERARHAGRRADRVARDGPGPARLRRRRASPTRTRRSTSWSRTWRRPACALDRSQPGSTLAAEGHWVDRLPEAALA